MPIIYLNKNYKAAKIGIWQITEDENFFLEKIEPQKSIVHPNKRIQHLASRYLLYNIEPQIQLNQIQINKLGKPSFINNQYYLSFSNCTNYGAVIINTKKNCGIDIEPIGEKALKISAKFLSVDERKLFINTPIASEQILATIFWSVKESVFKWYGLGGVDFKKNIVLKKISLTNNNFFVLVKFEKNECFEELEINGFYTNKFVCSYLVH